jgi:hypothetical protein
VNIYVQGRGKGIVHVYQAENLPSFSREHHSKVFLHRNKGMGTRGVHRHAIDCAISCSRPYKMYLRFITTGLPVAVRETL